MVNSGAEAIDGALKLAKRYTGREEIISMKNSYHGNTHGALSVSGNEFHKREFRPLLPMISFIEFDNEEEFSKITEKRGREYQFGQPHPVRTGLGAVTAPMEAPGAGGVQHRRL